MKADSLDALSLGPDVLQLLLPHRRPFLMVDRLVAYGREPRPYLRAYRLITANEPVFEGHFPDWQIWPGAYTFEGLGQCCNVLCVLEAVMDLLSERGHPEDAAREALLNLERGYRLNPGFRPEDVGILSELKDSTSLMIGFAVSCEMKWLAPVMASDRLDYFVEQTHCVDDMLRFRIEAEVAGRPVAKGILTSKTGVRFPWRESGP